MVATRKRSKPKLLVIVGETASGKSALAMRIAKEFNGELITADSWTVYKGFDIGTAKPTPDEQKEIPHHLLNVADPEEGFSAPKFKRLAEVAITDIQNRGKLPIMVGGTGLYIDSVIFDYGFLPRNVGDRSRLDKTTLQELLAEAKSKNIDLKAIDIRNKRRVIRAIENNGQSPTMGELLPGTLLAGVALSREELRARVTQRVEKMFEEGLEAEVRELSLRYGWDAEPMKGIGYREWQRYFAGEQDLGQTRERIISATMGLAKRQRTWFKRNKNILWFASTDEAFKELSKILNT